MKEAELPATYRLPEAYDIINARGTAREVDGLERIAARFVLGKKGKGSEQRVRGLAWLEPFSGSGRFVRLIAIRMGRAGGARGGRVVGVDLSEAMVEYSRARLAASGERAARHGGIVKGDVRRLRKRELGGKFDFAFCLHNSVRHLMTARDVVRHLRSVERVMKGGGVYVVGLELTPREEMFASEAVYVGRRGRVRVREVFTYLPPGEGGWAQEEEAEGCETVISVIEIERGGEARVEMVESKYRLRCWSVGDWRRMVDRAGLEEVGVVDSFGNDVGMGYARYALRVLRKRARTRRVRKPEGRSARHREITAKR